MASTLQLEIESIQLNDYVTLAVLVTIGFDYILTFSDEIEYLWSPAWTRVSALFILVRYFGLCNIVINAILGSSFLPGPATAGYLIFSAVGLKWSLFVPQITVAMILRVGVLYNQSKIVLGALLVLFSAGLVLTFITCVLQSIADVPIEVTARVLDYGFCVEQFNTPTWNLITGCVQIALGGLMCLLVVAQFIRESVQMYKATKHFRLNNYMNLLLREGVIYFLTILMYALINVLIATKHFPKNRWWMLLLIPQQITPYTLVPRFILGLRKLYAQKLQGRCGSEIDMAAFGLSSHLAGMSAVMFADVEKNEGEQGSDIDEIRVEVENHSSESSVS